MKANRKWLKAVLVSGVKKLGLFFLASKLSKFPFFDNSFSNLANFWDLDNFLVFDDFWDLNNFLIYNNFPYFSIDLLPPSMLPTSLAANISLATSTCDDRVVFSIDVSNMAILLKS